MVDMKNLALFALSILIITGYLFDAYLVLSGKVATSDPNQMLMIGNVIGGIQGMATTVAAFYFGSNKGSDDKNTAITNMTAKLPVQPNVTTVEAKATTIAGEPK